LRRIKWVIGHIILETVLKSGSILLGFLEKVAVFILVIFLKFYLLGILMGYKAK